MERYIILTSVLMGNKFDSYAVVWDIEMGEEQFQIKSYDFAFIHHVQVFFPSKSNKLCTGSCCRYRMKNFLLMS